MLTAIQRSFLDDYRKKALDKIEKTARAAKGEAAIFDPQVVLFYQRTNNGLDQPFVMDIHVSFLFVNPRLKSMVRDYCHYHIDKNRRDGLFPFAVLSITDGYVSLHKVPDHIDPDDTKEMQKLIERTPLPSKDIERMECVTVVESTDFSEWSHFYIYSFIDGKFVIDRNETKEVDSQVQRGGKISKLFK